MKNTPLTELIRQFEAKIKEQEITGEIFTIYYCIESAKGLLNIEKQDLIDAHYEGQKECSNEFAMESDAILYFKETFKQ